MPTMPTRRTRRARALEGDQDGSALLPLLPSPRSRRLRSSDGLELLPTSTLGSPDGLELMLSTMLGSLDGLESMLESKLGNPDGLETLALHGACPRMTWEAPFSRGHQEQGRTGNWEEEGRSRQRRDSSKNGGAVGDEEWV